jgi:hypothetical protein
MRQLKSKPSEQKKQDINSVCVCVCERERERLTKKRWMRVLFFWPMRCTRLIACASAAGLSNGSTRTTCCASKRLRPLAPCWIKSNSTWIDFGSDPSLPFVPFGFPLNWLMEVCAFLNSQIHNEITLSIMKLKHQTEMSNKYIIKLDNQSSILTNKILHNIKCSQQKITHYNIM